MAIIDLIDARPYRPAHMELNPRGSVLSNSPPLAPHIVHTTEIGFPLWICRMEFGRVTREQQHDRAGFWAQMRGRANRLRAWNIDQPHPFGTIRGAGTTSTSVAVGATQFTLSHGTAGATLRRGDMFSMSGMLFIATAPAVVAGGIASITFEPPARKAVSSGVLVNFEKPSAVFMSVSDEIIMPFEPFTAPGFTVELVEDIV